MKAFPENHRRASALVRHMGCRIRRVARLHDSPGCGIGFAPTHLHLLHRTATMAQTARQIKKRIGLTARNVAVTLIAGVCRWVPIEEINARICARPMRDQVLITVGVLAILAGLSLLAAQFGWIGMLVFWLAVIVIAN